MSDLIAESIGTAGAYQQEDKSAAQESPQQGKPSLQGQLRAAMQEVNQRPCLDNDKAGITGMERLEQTIREDPELSQRVKLIFHNPPPAEYGKDYNEFLCVQIKQKREMNRKKTVEHHNAL